MNPRAAINDLLPFQGSPFSLFGTSPILTFMHPRQKIKPPDLIWWFVQSGEGGIRTHAPLRTNGFQDRLVMTTSIPLHNFKNYMFKFFVHRCLSATSGILTLNVLCVNYFFNFFFTFFYFFLNRSVFPAKSPFLLSYLLVLSA